MSETTPQQRYLARASLHQSDDALEAECDVQFFIAGGPGGQHRNKAETAVRLVHRPTGLMVTASERRSQAQNRVMAIVRLREKLHALTVVPKERKPTKISRTQKAKRLDAKRHQGSRKRDRNWRDD